MVPLLWKSKFSVGAFNVSSISNYYADGITDIDWVSSDPSIVQVSGSDLLGLYPGTATITGTYKGATVTAEVSVYDCGIKSDDVSIQTQNICLFPGESFRLLATQKDAVFTTKDASVATVASDGTVTAHAIGTTTVTVTNPKNSIDCVVRVVADDGTYLKSSLDTEYPLTEERTVLVSDSFYLFVDIGVYLPDNILEKIELIMSTMEKETGLSFNNPKLKNNYEKLFPVTKPSIVVINHCTTDYAYGGADGVTLSPYDISIDEYGAYVLIHEMLHTLQHRNGIHLGNSLTEGFAIYYSRLIREQLPFPIYHDEYYNSWACMGPFDEITLENTESSLLDPPDSHPFSYFFVRYLAETYGKDKFYTLMDAITEAARQKNGAAYAGQWNALDEETIYRIIKENTSDNLTEEFYRYFSSLEESNQIHRELLNENGVCHVDYLGNRRMRSTSVGGMITFNQEITLDYTYAFDYAEKVWGLKAKGIGILPSVIEDNQLYYVDTIFYDQSGNIIPVSGDPHNLYKSVVPGAVKVTLRGVNECQCFVNNSDMFGE